MKKLTTPDDVRDLLTATSAAAALGAAIETGLLWRLADKPLNEAEAAQAVGIPLKRCGYWLQYLHFLGILEWTAQGYAPAAITRQAILDRWGQESWRHLALDERERSASVLNLGEMIRTPGSISRAQGLPIPKNYVEKMRDNPARAREFTRMLYEVHQRLANELAEFLDLSGVRSLMDVGGNSGVVSLALLQKYPDLTATVVDIETVCAAGREIAKESSVADRITYRAADLLRDDLPQGFDLALKCDVFVFEQELFDKLWASLNEGGRLVLVDHFSPAENIAPLALLEWAFLDSLEDPDYSVPTIPQVQAKLTRAGFTLLPGAHTLSDRRIVIQAQKGTSAEPQVHGSRLK